MSFGILLFDDFFFCLLLLPLLNLQKQEDRKVNYSHYVPKNYLRSQKSKDYQPRRNLGKDIILNVYVNQYLSMDGKISKYVSQFPNW